MTDLPGCDVSSPGSLTTRQELDCCVNAVLPSLLQIRADVKDHPELYSQIYTPHPVVIPGGRFRELYYW